jgi:hypothetical protein
MRRTDREPAQVDGARKAVGRENLCKCVCDGLFVYALSCVLFHFRAAESLPLLVLQEYKGKVSQLSKELEGNRKDQALVRASAERDRSATERASQQTKAVEQLTAKLSAAQSELTSVSSQLIATERQLTAQKEAQDESSRALAAATQKLKDSEQRIASLVAQNQALTKHKQQLLTAHTQSIQSALKSPGASPITASRMLSAVADTNCMCGASTPLIVRCLPWMIVLFCRAVFDVCSRRARGRRDPETAVQ